MSARRSLLTTAAAGALLGALCFVPSANATSPATHEAPRSESASSPHTTASGTATETTTEASDRLAETGGFDTTPYVVGGTAFLSLGAGFVVFSVRRERTSGGKVSYRAVRG
ncbi:LAETG motif-containing sortase-dependent surface protein [Streptomyces sp. Je 1-369]|uniref:LAETG motif-containing sortase-dependent surface protein n=1 Tax=Streptomyces sp. Je 1-369 TaxID=2966192 RepID=UPI0022862DBC|nr:LAETG motif-containing sortase-dependent surface protein [Streptomyces sp. Je 1-369]WAL97532.1 LPXTG cell wall anchor domain-containing protein [Streptomyces sp. Je 1-369]